jgi:DNA-binding NtrC family response regulator
MCARTATSPNNGKNTFMSDRHGSRVADMQVAEKGFLHDEERKARGGKIKVLVVDDESEPLLDAVGVFREGGFNVLTASSGSEALKVLAAEPGIGMLFTDVLMRGMDGVTLGRKARALVPDIEVVLVSLLPSLAMELHSGEPGEFSFLMKPFLMSEVELVLRK